jgi:hypothetical protein
VTAGDGAGERLMARKVYLYRLNVMLPPEAADPDREPQAWLDQLPPYPAEGAPPEALEGRFQ